MSTWLDSLYQNQYFKPLVHVPVEYIEEQVKDQELLSMVQNSSAAIKLLLHDIIVNKEMQSIIENSALQLYGLIHARFIQTDTGKHAILMKYIENNFPPCPRSLCHQCECLPYGVSSKLGVSGLLWYCPNCGDLYIPKQQERNALIDGAFFGPKYVIQLIKQHPDIVQKQPPEVFEPRIFGFRLKDLPQMME